VDGRAPGFEPAIDNNNDIINPWLWQRGPRANESLGERLGEYRGAVLAAGRVAHRISALAWGFSPD
jgi:hypothetical protein